MIKTANIFLCSAVLFLLFSCGGKKVEDDRAEFNITSEPAGAKLVINNIEVGVTPKTMKLKPATYIMEVSKLNYKSSWKKLTAGAKQQKNIEIPLEPVTSSVLITSNPAGAAVEIDGSQVGQTPLILHGQTVGKHTATIKKPGLVTQELSWTVEDARPQEVKCALLSNVGTLAVSSTPAGASVFIDGKPRGRTPFNESMEQGEHKLKVEKAGYSTYEQTVVVTREQKKDVSVELQILPGSISASSTPSEASVFLNDNPAGKTPLEIKSLQPGEYTLRFEKKGFDPETRKVTVSPGVSADVSVELGSNRGGIDLVVNPPGVTIYLDEQKIGVTQEGEDKHTSKVFEIRDVMSGEHTIKVVHKRALPQTEKSISVQVAKGKITRPKPILMWIADTQIKLKSGKTMTGRIRQQNDAEIIFEPEPGIAQRYSRDEIESVKELQIVE